MKYKTIAYDSAKHILAMPDHYVSIARKATKATKATEAGGMVVKEGDRFIIKAGTIYPSNDNKAIGVVLQDYDVTESDVSMAIVLHGFIRADRLPTQPSDAALKNLRMIYFLKNDMTILQPADASVGG
jgi:prophage protein